MRINPVTVKMSAHVAQRLLDLANKRLDSFPNDTALQTAIDELYAALAERK